MPSPPRLLTGLVAVVAVALPLAVAAVALPPAARPATASAAARIGTAHVGTAHVGTADVGVDADCTRTHTGRVPLTDLGAGSYLGQQGGLYPGGTNVRPGPHNTAGVHLATNLVVPRDPAGAPNAGTGRVVLLSIGMSNTAQEFQRFAQRAPGIPGLDPRLRIVNGAQGGQDARDWSSPTSPTWTEVDRRLAAAGVTAAQVQVVWLKQQFGGDALGTFPGGAATLRDALRDIVTIAHARYPNLRILHLSSRTYGDYHSAQRGRGAYESGWAAKWLVADQIGGDPRLDYRGSDAVAPWLAWGPYLWADGLGADDQPGGIPGRSDGLEWACGDFVTDGIHPSTTGRDKVADALTAFYTGDPTAAPWFLA